VVADEAVKPAPRVLVAEDNPASRRLVDIILTCLGYRLTLVVDGREAVLAANAQAFDLVLMDLRMPGIDGFEAARRIRRLPFGKGSAPIVAVTADVRPRVESDVLAAGMNACLFKPIDILSLTETVAAWAGASPRLGQVGPSGRDLCGGGG
jgi:CheY-like chemotaxis protein